MSTATANQRLDAFVPHQMSMNEGLKQALSICIEALHCDDAERREQLTSEARSILAITETVPSRAHVQDIHNARHKARLDTEAKQRRYREVLNEEPLDFAAEYDAIRDHLRAIEDNNESCWCEVYAAEDSRERLDSRERAGWYCPTLEEWLTGDYEMRLGRERHSCHGCGSAPRGGKHEA